MRCQYGLLGVVIISDEMMDDRRPLLLRDGRVVPCPYRRWSEILCRIERRSFALSRQNPAFIPIANFCVAEILSVG
jgi:hypothetical protein